jgi:hypothetical protein
MKSDDLLKPWKRTEGFLLDARSNLSELAESQCADEIREFEERLGTLTTIVQEFEKARKARGGGPGLLGAHFGRPFDMLEAVYDKSGVEGLRVLELMALAAASCGDYKRQRRYYDRISKACGLKYETVLPE